MYAVRDEAGACEENLGEAWPRHADGLQKREEWTYLLFQAAEQEAWESCDGCCNLLRLGPEPCGQAMELLVEVGYGQQVRALGSDGRELPLWDPYCVT